MILHERDSFGIDWGAEEVKFHMALLSVAHAVPGTPQDVEIVTQVCPESFSVDGLLRSGSRFHASLAWYLYPHVVDINDIFFEESLRGQGNGSRFLEALEDSARAMGAATLRASGIRNRRYRDRMISQLGFIPENEHRVYKIL